MALQPWAVWAKDKPTENNEFLNLQERLEEKRREEIALERAETKSRFKLKAIENTKAREEKYKKIMERKRQKASRFQKEAWEEAEREKREQIEKAKQPSKSRFTEKAKQKAAERALKREEKQQRLKRNQKKL